MEISPFEKKLIQNPDNTYILVEYLFIRNQGCSMNLQGVIFDIIV